MDLLADKNAAVVTNALANLNSDAALFASIPMLRSLTFQDVGNTTLVGVHKTDRRTDVEVGFQGFVDALPYVYGASVATHGENPRLLVSVADTALPENLLVSGWSPIPSNDEMARLNRELAQSENTVLSEVPREVDNIAVSLGIRVSVPIIGESGARAGTIFLYVDLAILLRFFGMKPDAGSTVLVWTNTGHAVFKEQSPPSVQSRGLGPNRLGARSSGEEHQSYASFDESLIRPRSIQVGSAGNPLMLRVDTLVTRPVWPSSTVSEMLRELLLSGALIACAMIATLSIGRRLLDPLKQLQSWIETKDSQSLGCPDLAAKDNELGELARAFVSLSNDLAAETAKARAIFRAAANAIVVVGKTGVVEEVNAAAESVFGRPHDAIVGGALSDLIAQHGAEDFYGMVRQLVEGSNHMPFTVEVEHQKSPGADVQIEIAVSATENQSGFQLVLIARDVTARRLSEARVSDLIVALERSNGELDQFAYIASHDLKAPLRVIENASSWLAEDLAPHLTDETRENLALLQNRVRRMRRLLDDLLAHSRIGRDAHPSQTVSGKALLRDLEGLLDIPDGFHVTASDAFKDIRLPAMPIKMVLLNLVDNAVKHHHAKTGTIFMDATFGATCFQFSVSDDGPGIAPKYHDKIFEMFRTLKPRDSIEASGMGLAMVRKQVDLIGGALSVESEVGAGTTFHVSWPRAPRGVFQHERMAS